MNKIILSVNDFSNGGFMRTFLLKAKHFFRRNIYPITITVCTVLVLGIITISAYNSLKTSNEVVTQTNNQNVVENQPNADRTEDDVPTGANPDLNEPESSKPIVKEILPPYISLTKTSKPLSSVPSKCSPLGSA